MQKNDILETQGKENLSMVERMKAYKDPLLDDFDAQ
jgi:hypothetical protein